MFNQHTTYKNIITSISLLEPTPLEDSMDTQGGGGGAVKTYKMLHCKGEPYRFSGYRQADADPVRDKYENVYITTNRYNFFNFLDSSLIILIYLIGIKFLLETRRRSLLNIFTFYRFHKVNLNFLMK